MHQAGDRHSGQWVQALIIIVSYAGLRIVRRWIRPRAIVGRPIT